MTPTVLTSPRSIIFTDDLSDVYLIRVTQNTKVISMVLALLEVFATLPDEARFIWTSDWSTMKVIYLINKYSVLIDAIMTIVVEVGSNNIEECALKLHMIVYSYVIGTVFSELILIVRTIAVWAFNKYMVATLLAASTLILAFALVWMTRVTQDNGSPDVILKTLGCVIYSNDGSLWPVYTCLIALQTGIVVLLLWRKKTVAHTSGSANHAVVRTIFYDGTIFFAIVLAMSIANLLVMLLARPHLAPLLQMPLRVVHSAVCTRVLLNLRRAAAKSTSSGTTLIEQRTTLAFSSDMLRESTEIEGQCY